MKFPFDLEIHMVKKTTETKKRGRAAKIPVDWEALAKNLQKALEKEIDEHEFLQKKHDILLDRADRITAALFKAQGVIEYLEEKNGNDPV
jgi:hypothetical protein